MMDMPSRRTVLTGLLALGMGSTALNVLQTASAEDAATAPAKAAPAVIPPGGVSVDGLGKILAGLGLKASQSESRFDFMFATKTEEEWELSMSAVLSNDQKTIWIMAWLDECPTSAADVPRNALLNLLSDNDLLGNGKFFAFVKSNRRFVLQRVITNTNITRDSMKADLLDLGKTVIATHPHWSVGLWNSTAPATTAAPATGKPAATATKPAAGATK